MDFNLIEFDQIKNKEQRVFVLLIQNELVWNREHY